MALLVHNFARVLPSDHQSNVLSERTPVQSHADVEADVTSFMEGFRPTMRRLVKNASHLSSLLPTWQPDPSADKDLIENISKLRIPVVDGKPSLLLHDLGEEKGDIDKQRVAHIWDIMSFSYHTCVT
jgi:hypothetical protein